MNGLAKSVRVPSSALFDGVGHAHELALAGGGLDVVAHIVVEDDHAGGVALLVGEIGERHGQEPAVVELGDAVRAVAHGGAGIEHQRELRVGFAAIALQVSALGAGEDVPIDVAQIVAGRVGAILGEFLAESEVGRTMQARDKAVHHGLGDQVQVRDAGQERRIDEAGWMRCMHVHANWPSADVPAVYLLFRFGLPLQQALQDRVRIQALGFGVEVEQNAMAQDRARPARGCLRRRRDSGCASGRGPWRPARGTARRARWRRSSRTS